MASAPQPEAPPEDAVTPSHDLRTPLLGLAAWTGSLVGVLAGGWWAVALVGSACVALGLRVTGRTGRTVLVVCLLVAAAVAGSAALRAETLSRGAVVRLADSGAVGQVEVVVTSDPVVRAGRFGSFVVLRASLRALEARGGAVRAAVPLLVIADEEWAEVELGSRVRFVGRLGDADSPDLAAVVSARGAPELVAPPSAWFDGAAAVRGSVRDANAHGPGESSGLVPALVTGDEERLAEDVVEDFRTSGLTHLTAVSGTNLTLVLGFLLVLARWAGVTARGLLVVGLLGVVGFVLLARPEPSVVRAAAMGTVALLALGAGGRAAGVRALGAAVLLLLVADPWLGTSVGFALSVLATAGILFVAPGFRDALAEWMPRWLAEAVAVPLAAQLACTPLVAALSGQVSLVAVMANMLVAPLVGPATVLGLAAGLVGLVLEPLGVAVGWVACLFGQGIVEVATHAADLPAAALDWPAHAGGLGVLTALSMLLLAGAGPVLRRPRAFLAVTAVLAVAMLRPLPSPGWPPPGWVLVMCDVGQGDALVLSVGPAAGVVVDTGPDPDAVDACLDRLGVRRLPAVVLTHFHADHVDGLPGALDGRAVGEIQVTTLRAPEEGADRVDRWAAEAGVPVRAPAYGERATAGAVTWQVVGPRRVTGESPNDASVVLLVETHGVRLLLTGDVEPTSQGALLREAGLGPVDVLKVPHHGSRYQDDRLLTGLRPRVALVSVGADNDYGHPDDRVVGLLADSGVRVLRTDELGDVAVVVRDGELRTVSRGR